MIKNIYNSAAFVLMAILALTSCSPQDGDNHSLGAIDTITAEQVSFSTTVSPTSSNVVTYTVTTDTNAPYSVLWDFGNGTTSKNKTATVEYPLPEIIR